MLESDYYFLFQLEKRDFEYECITWWGIYTGFKNGNFNKWENDKNEFGKITQKLNLLGNRW